MKLVAKIQKNQLQILSQGLSQQLSLLFPLTYQFKLGQRVYFNHQITALELQFISSRSDLHSLREQLSKFHLIYYNNFTSGSAFEKTIGLLRQIFTNITQESTKPTIASIKGVLTTHSYYHFDSESYYNFQNLNQLKLGVKKYSDSQLQFPFLFASTRGGGSFFYIENPECYRRLAGSIIGQLTFKNFIEFATDFEDAKIAVQTGFAQGDISKTDLFVKDIYGQNTHTLKLPENLIASSMGKVGRDDIKLQAKDIAKSFAISIAINFSQIAVNLLKLQSLDRVVVACDLFQTNIFQLQVQSLIKQYNKHSQVWFPASKHVVQLGYLV